MFGGKMENRTLMSVLEAEEAYKKFLKSSRGIFGFNFKKKENLKSFSEIQKEENAYNSVNLGIKEVPLDKIVGSVEKYADFDKNFVPKNNVVKQRWINIYIGYTSDSMLPTVILYKIKDNYYVYDGNHRVSVAKFLNFATIEAQVEEFLPTKDTKDKVIYRENMIFEKETGFSDIFLSEPIKYKYLKEEIESYKNLLDKRKNENMDLKKAAKNWHINVFLPIKMILSENEIIKNYEGNPDDVFLFFLEHKYYLSKNLGKNVGYLYSIINFINLVKTNENKDLENICEIQTQELTEKCKKLEKIDNELINSNFKHEIKAEIELENEVISYFRNAVEKLSNRYSSYLFESEKMTNNEIWTYFAKYILNYIKILNTQKNNDFSNMNRESIIGENNFEKEQITKSKIEFDNIEVNVLNYILEVLYTQEPMERTECLLSDLLMRHQVERCHIESNNGGHYFSQNIEELSRNMGNTLTRFLPFHQRENKAARIFACSTSVQRMTLMPMDWKERFPAFAHDLIGYLRTGGNAHDDAPDALTGAIECRQPKRKIPLSELLQW